jgi:hypothetical protein
MTSSPHLRRWYNKYNKEYFAGMLPTRKKILLLDERHEEGCDGNYIMWTDGTFTIWVDPECTPGQQHQALLHEMVHVLCCIRNGDGGHSDLFHREMARLAKLGAFRKLW